jgi:hypothetical protein
VRFCETERITSQNTVLFTIGFCETKGATSQKTVLLNIGVRLKASQVRRQSYLLSVVCKTERRLTSEDILIYYVLFLCAFLLFKNKCHAFRNKVRNWVFLFLSLSLKKLLIFLSNYDEDGWGRVSFNISIMV